MLPSKIAFVDIETTGGNVTRDRVIEIGIVRVENNKIVRTYSTLINPDCYVSPFIENLTGITAKELESAPIFFEIKDEVIELLKDCVFVAHNARFDYGFLRNEFKRYNTSFSYKHFCTVKLSRTLYPTVRGHNLDALIERFGLVCANRHRAFDDAKILYDFYLLVQQQFPLDVVVAAVTTALKRPSRPIHLSEEQLDSLPESPGVYIFYSEEGTVLYVGKSINIRDRVLSHFTSDVSSHREMELSDQVHHIETIVTSGELSALFKESQLVKELQPLFNRKLRLKRTMMVLFKSTTSEGYDTVSLQEINALQVSDLDRVLAVVRSKKQGTDLLRGIAKESALCPKVLGLESASDSCFSYQLGWCKGACIQKEQPLLYNLRQLSAFSQYKIKKWPFRGPIKITEVNEYDDKREYFVIDSWCYLGSIQEEVGAEISSEYVFDLDMYKILVQYMNKPSNHRRITPLDITMLSHNNIDSI